MLERTFDPARVNAVYNHPAVRPFVGGGAAVLDMGAVLANPANICLAGEHGCFIFAPLDGDLYEAHTAFVPEGRGPQLVPVAQEALRWMFTRTEAAQIVTKCPVSNPGTLGLGRAVGMRVLFERDAAWLSPDGTAGAVRYMGIDLDGWRARDPELSAWGARFHAALEQAKAAAGSSLPAHPHDEAHDRAVGAAYLTLIASQPEKAVHAYNRWALFAGYAPISLVSAQPLLVDVGDALVSLKGDDLEVLHIRGPVAAQPQQHAA